MTNFHKVSESLPQYTDFVWIKCEGSDEINLAYYSKYKDQPEFQHAETVGDKEGLSVEYYDNVTHWAKLETPRFYEAEMDHVHKLQFHEKGGAGCENLGCPVCYPDEQIIEVLEQFTPADWNEFFRPYKEYIKTGSVKPDEPKLKANR